jgi:hypothetical protein
MRHSILEILGRTVRTYCVIEAYESKMAEACRISMVLLCYNLQLIQRINIELSLGHLNECVLRFIHLENHQVTCQIVVHPWIFADMQLIVRDPLDLRCGLIQDVCRAVLTELVND